MSSFGWNFYGFFVMAAAWIAIYFAWAKWMEMKAMNTELTPKEHGRNTGSGTDTERP